MTFISVFGQWALCITVSRDLVNHKKMEIVRNRYQKWKEHNEISKIFTFEVTDVKVRHFTFMFMLKK